MQEDVRSVGVCLALIAPLMFLTPLGNSVRTSMAISAPKKASESHASLGRRRAPNSQPEAKQKVVERYLRRPLVFEANNGQTNPRVKFISRGDGYSIFLTGHNAVLKISQTGVPFAKKAAAPGKILKAPRGGATVDVLKLELAGSNPSAYPKGLGPLPGKSNYFIGNNSAQWRTNIPQYSRVEYASIYPGINLVYYGSQGHLEYDFDVLPGGDPRSITLSISGLHVAENALAKQSHHLPRVDSQGNLVMETPGGSVTFAKPVAYQLLPAASGKTEKSYVKSRFVVHSPAAPGVAQIGFWVESYNKKLPLVIDPVLTYSTYIGGSLLDRAQSVALDGNGNAYVTGNTASIDFPTQTGVYEAKCDNGGTCQGNAFVMELTPSTSTLVYSTYLGGDANDTGFAIAVDAHGNAFLAGEATSTNFPVTPDALQATCGGTTNCEDAFVSEFGPGGASLIYSTYLGGNGNDEANTLTLDSKENVYVAGLTASTNFPVTLGAYQTKCGTDGKCNGGAADGFFTMLNFASGRPSMVYSTYLGGSGADFVEALAVDSQANVYLTGETKSTDFPTTSGVYQTSCILDKTQSCEGDAFVSKINPAATGRSSLVYSTRLGGSGEEAGNGIAVDSLFDAYITGFTTSSTDFPLQNPYQATYGGALQDAFVTKFNPTGSTLIFSTYLGGSNYNIATGISLGVNNTIYLTGSSNSSNFPITSDALYTVLNQGSSNTCSGVTCRDVIVTEFDSSGTGLLFSSYLGGGSEDEGNGIVLDSSGNAYVAGFTTSDPANTPIPFPTHNPTAAACVGTCGTAGASNAGDAFLSELGQLAAPFALFNTTSASFGNQDVGTKSSPQAVTLTNSGNAPLTITSITLAGANPTDFSETDHCVSGSPLAPGASCTANVTFAPTAAGTFTATLQVADSAANSPQAISLSGTGVLVSLSISPASLTFPSQALGTTSNPQTVTLTNTGSTTLTITAISITGTNAGDFTDSPTCASSLAPSATCTIGVTFKPTQVGPLMASLSVTDNAPGSPQAVPLSGAGTGPGASLSPSNLNFGSQTVNTMSNSQAITLTNNGTAALTITGISIAGADAADFSESNTCGSSLAANGNCTIHVTFKPAAGGSLVATLSIADNAPGSPQNVSLAGSGADFAITATTKSQTVSPGSNATYQLSLTPQGGFNQSISFTCAGQPAASTCKVNPLSVTPNANGSATPLTVTVVTTAASLAPPVTRSLPPASQRGLWFVTGLGFLLLMGFSNQRKSRRAAWVLVPVMLWVLMASACGSNSPSTNNSSAGTPPGTYQLTVTGTAGSLTNTANLSLTVN
jgi:hypothetical protein